MANRVRIVGKNPQHDGEDSTISLLRVIVSLLLRRKEEHLLPLKQQIEILDEMGIRPAEIARIIGRTSTYVGKELVGIRRARGQGRSRDGKRQDK
jgi:hypothetical protein